MRNHGHWLCAARSSTSTACWSTRRTSSAWRDSLEELMETNGADIQPETSYSPERFTQVYQQVMSGKPRFAGAQAALEYFGVPDAETRAKDVRRPQTGDGRQADRGGRVHRLPRRAALHHRGQRRRDPASRPRPPQRMRTCSCARSGWTRSRQENGMTSEHVTPGAEPPGVLRCGYLGPRFRPGQAASRDLPHRGQRARGAARGMLRRRGRGVGHPGGQGGRDGRARRSRAPTTRSSSPPPSRTCW